MSASRSKPSADKEEVPELYTKQEAKNVMEEISAFLEGIEKRDGKKFNHSAGVVAVIMCAKKKGDRPSGDSSLVNGNGMTLQIAAVRAVKSVSAASKETTSSILMKIGMAVLMDLHE